MASRLSFNPNRSVQRVVTRTLLFLNVCQYLCTFSVSLQIQMYQLSRLLHDYHRELYNHLEDHEISPSLYAAPWFLTLFASQFPLGFVSRVFGNNTFIFLTDLFMLFRQYCFLMKAYLVVSMLPLFQISCSSKGQGWYLKWHSVCWAAMRGR